MRSPKSPIARVTQPFIGYTKRFILLWSAQAFIFQPLAYSGPNDQSKPLTPNKTSNECWKTNDGKEICDQPKPTSLPNGQFKFKEVNTTDKLKAAYEEEQASQNSYFPQAALKASRENEVRELGRVEMAEKENIKNRDLIESKKIEAMQEIQKHKFEMADHRIKQEKMSEDMELMQDELVKLQGQQDELNSQAKAVKARYEAVADKHQESAEHLHASQLKLAAEAEALNKKRVDTEKKVSQMQIEMQQSIAQIAKDQSLIARAESERVQYESQEIHVANLLSSLLERRKEIADEREKASLEISQLQKRVDAIRSDYKVSKSETENLEKEVQALTTKLSRDRVNSSAEIAEYERKILLAKDSKFKNEYERSRLVAESDKMKAQLVDAQKRYDQAAADETAASLAVMESRVDFETARTDVSTKESGIEDLKFHGKKQREQIRNLASLAESSQMLETQQKAKVVKACKVLSRPENSSDSVGRLKKGSIIVAAPASSGFFKVLNSSGSPQFVYQTCLEVLE